jgi:G:T/U-mismatch repair DNA glycosylase
VTEAVDAEYGAFQAERAAGVTEVLELRKTVAEEEERKRVERAEAERLKEDAEEAGAAAPIATDPKPATDVDIEMGDADDDSATVRTAASKEAEEEAEKKDDAAMQGGDDDDAVEY